MSWTSLQMIPLGLLLLFGDRPLCAGSSRCIRDQVCRRLERFQRWLNHSDVEDQKSSAADLSTRSVSPWRYRTDINASRCPEKIIMAECLHQGCNINGEHTNAYNSAEVTMRMKVFYISDDPNKCVERWIMVPVACTCVAPKY